MFISLFTIQSEKINDPNAKCPFLQTTRGSYTMSNIIFAKNQANNTCPSEIIPNCYEYSVVLKFSHVLTSKQGILNF